MNVCMHVCYLPTYVAGSYAFTLRYVSVHTYIYMYLYIHIDVHIHIYIYVHMYIYIHVSSLFWGSSAFVLRLMSLCLRVLRVFNTKWGLWAKLWAKVQDWQQDLAAQSPIALLTCA